MSRQTARRDGRWRVLWPPLALVLVTVAASACGADDQRTDSVDPATVRDARAGWDPATVAQLDSGNAALGAEDFDGARRHFLAVTEQEADAAAGWFGLYLAERGRGDLDAAAAAFERASELAPDASLIWPDPVGAER